MKLIEWEVNEDSDYRKSSALPAKKNSKYAGRCRVNQNIIGVIK